MHLVASNQRFVSVFFFFLPITRLAVLTSQLNERRAPLFRPNSGQPAGPRQGKQVTHLVCCFYLQFSSYTALGRLLRFLIKSCISFVLYIVFPQQERGFQCCHICWGCAFVISMCLTSSGSLERGALLCMDGVLSAVCFPLVNGWFDHNRWFIWSLSCEWGCTIPSTNDGGSQAPPFGPSGAKNWPVWWVPVDYFTFSDLHHSWTSSLRYNLVSLNLSPLAHLTSLSFSALSPSSVLPFISS